MTVVLNDLEVVQTEHIVAEVLHRDEELLLVANRRISGVDWLQCLDSQIAWIEGDPIQEISSAINQQKQAGKTISELHIFAHGSNGEIKLGNTLLTSKYLKESSHLLHCWSLKSIYLWSCKAGLNKDLIETFQKLAGADVYSSESRISREQPNIVNDKQTIASLETYVGLQQIQSWTGSLSVNAPFLGKAASSYQEVSIAYDTVLASPPSGVTITARTLIDDGSGNISLSSASNSYVSTLGSFPGDPQGFGVLGTVGSGHTTEIGYHNASGLSEQLIIEFDEIVPEIGFATAFLADVEGDGIYKMYRDSVLVKTGAVDGVTDHIDPPVNLSSDDGYGFDKIEFTANGWQNDYLVHKITYDAPKENNAATASLNELADASSQDIASQSGSLTVSDADNSGTITASIVGDP